MINSLVPIDQSVTILKKPVIAITEDEKNALKTAIDKWAEMAKAQKVRKPIKYIAERDKLLVEWIFNTGMRISDALLVNYRDIDMDKEEVTFIIKKRSKKQPFIHTISMDKSILFEVQRFKDMFLIRPEDKLFMVTRQTFDDNLVVHHKVFEPPI